jgi:murein L,D-transpeptidase YcbB/YkuD
MMPDVVSKLPAPNRARFEKAYADKKRPIGWWDPDDVSVGLVQAWLVTLGESLPISTKVDPADGGVIADGVFGRETFDAVVSFQKKKGLKADGMVGHDTLDAIRDALKARLRQVDSPVFVKKPIERERPPRRCPPGSLICRDPDER